MKFVCGCSYPSPNTERECIWLQAFGIPLSHTNCTNHQNTKTISAFHRTSLEYLVMQRERHGTVLLNSLQPGLNPKTLF